MKKIIKYAFITLLIGLLSGCEQELLEQSNPNAITSSSFWKTKEDFGLATNALYSSLQFPSVSGGDIVANMLRGDMAGTESWYGSALMYTNLTWNDASPFVVDRWSQLYIGIYRANQILYYIDQVSFLSDEEKTVLAAQARFLRGLNYFWLAITYNQAVIQDKLALNDEDRHKPLSPRSEVISQMVIPDLEFAYNNLPKKWTGAENIGRFTWGAAASMLGKTYLYEKDWTKSAKYFKEVVDAADNDGLYRLVPNFMDNFTIENEYNSESILEVAFSDNYKPGVNGNRVDDLPGVYGAEATSIANAFASIVGAGGYNTVLPTYWLQELFVSADSIDVNNSINAGKRYSQRTFATIAVEFGDGDYYQAPLTTSGGKNSKANFNYGQGSKVKKYTSWYYKDTEDAATSARSGINFRHIRLADVYLMYAEALLERDGEAGVTEAMKYIEKVRARAGVISLQHFRDAHGGMIPVMDVAKFPNKLKDFNYVALNKASLMHHLRMVERPLELAFEGHRWYDLVRWGIVREVFDARKADEDKIKEILIGKYIKKTDGTADKKIYPLYLNERVRPDWPVPAATYNSSLHDYFPIPAIEAQSNKQF